MNYVWHWKQGSIFQNICWPIQFFIAFWKDLWLSWVVWWDFSVFCLLGFFFFFNNFISEEWGDADTFMILQEQTGYLKMFLFINSAAPEVSWITSLKSWLVKIGSSNYVNLFLEKVGDTKMYRRIYLFVWLGRKARFYSSLHFPQAAYWNLSERAAGKKTHNTHENLEKLSRNLSSAARSQFWRPFPPHTSICSLA